MMSTEVTLSIYDEQGREQQVAVQSKRFTIGRLPENDLPIPDTNLSRRHAVIENFDGAFYVSDCGSQNGTAVNRKSVTGAVELRDGDVITLGGAKDVVVHLSNGYASAGSAASAQFAAAPNNASFEQSPSASSQQTPTPSQASAPTGSTPAWLTTPVIAAAIAVVVVLFAGLLLALSSRTDTTPKRIASTQNIPQRRKPIAEKENRNAPTETQNNSSTEAATNVNLENSQVVTGNTSNAAADELDEIERYALRVMSSISNDTSPTLSRKALGEINEKVKRYRGSSSISDELRAMKGRGVSQLAGGAKSGDLKLPLVVYAALAKMDRDGVRGDPVPTAQGMIPVLSRLRVTFGTELANDSLLIIAAYDQGPGGTTHPLQTSIFELAKRQPESPATIRTVWYLHEHGKISPQAYELVLRFLALGVIAQDPHKFGVDAEPLGF